MADSADISIGTGTVAVPPWDPQTATIIVRSTQLRELIQSALRRLGLSWLPNEDPSKEPPGEFPESPKESPEESSSNPTPPNVAPSSVCTLMLVDQGAAQSLPAEKTEPLALSHDTATMMVVLILDQDDQNGDPAQPSHSHFDGVLRLPLSSEEMATRLADILHAHRAAADRWRPLLGEINLLRRVLQSVSTGVTIADAGAPDLPLIYVNSVFEKMTGYSLEEVRGRNCRFLQGPDADQPGLDAVREAIRDERETVAVLKNYRKDGTFFWNELYFSPLRDEQGRVTHFAGVQNDVSLRVDAQERLFFLAHHDSLTGLANRGLLFDRLEQAIIRSSRQGTSVALLFFDLNNFKNVNDMFGHSAGDQLLRIVGDRIKCEVRECDTVARLGGDEFVALIPDLEDENEIAKMVDRITARIGAEIKILEEAFHLSVSAGWSIYPRDGRDPDNLLKVADMAMYGDKHNLRQANREHADWLAEQEREF